MTIGSKPPSRVVRGFSNISHWKINYFQKYSQYMPENYFLQRINCKYFYRSKKNVQIILSMPVMIA